MANDGFGQNAAMQNAQTDHSDTTFDNVAHREVQKRVDAELQQMPEPKSVSANKAKSD
jgi:hypothetical protein